MKKQTIEKNNPDLKDFTICCPKYLDYLEECPSSKNIVNEDDLKVITSSCTSEKFKKCSIYCKINEKAA